MSVQRPLSGLKHPATRSRLPFLTQPVWKRFSYPNEYKQPGVKDLDATI